ncbi:hypothetical protein [Chryseobacterium sp.]|uniref:hypothetical protein n=1 Tax=Chryseobacterium sp. TaxID=1871047 RepID=UPI0025BE5BEC|nr:hypothetical protein [Chryseobacterium sp.]
MKNIYQYTVLVISLLISLFLLSCENGNDDNDLPVSPETPSLVKIQDITDNNYTVSIFNSTGKLSTGYNEVYLQVKNKATGEIINNGSLTWHPVMNMMSMSHSCPYSTIEKVSNQSYYKGFIIFQMAGNDSENWELTFNLKLNGQTYQLKDSIQVDAAVKRNVEVFTGADNQNYVLAMTGPSSPVVGMNDMTAYLFKMQDMDTFLPVDGYTIQLDPRMPGMGNHSSPNNTALISDSVSGFYKGKVSLTMTGYWKLNLMVLSSEGNVLKGEEVTAANDSSSLYFEVEF